MFDLVFIKLGGSLITDKSKPYTPRIRVINRLALEIKKSLDLGFHLVMSHGSGSFGHTLASKYKTADGIKDKRGIRGLCLVEQDAIAINRIVNKVFLNKGINCLSFVPSSFIFAQAKSLKSIFVEPIIKAVEMGIVPVVFGDVILDDKYGCCIYSGEEVLDNLFSKFKEKGYRVKKVIQCGVTDGVYDEKGKVIKRITPKNFPILRKSIFGSENTDVTGGMLHKVVESLKMAKGGTKVYIMNGKIKDNLYKSITKSNFRTGTEISF